MHAAAAEQARLLAITPSFLSPPPERLTPLDRQRAFTYRTRLEGEIRRLELTPGRKDLSSLNRLHNARNEVSRMRRLRSR